MLLCFLGNFSLAWFSISSCRLLLIFRAASLLILCSRLFLILLHCCLSIFCAWKFPPCEECASIQSLTSRRTSLPIQLRTRRSERRLTIERRRNVSSRVLRSRASRAASAPARRRGLRDVDSQRRRAVTATALRLARCHFATEQLVNCSLRAVHIFCRPYAPIPYRRPIYSVCALSVNVMREHIQSSWAARRWYLLVGIRWQRFQSRLAGVYHRRVTLPVQFWRALGAPSVVAPRLPWWSVFLYQWLYLTGYTLPRSRRRR